MKIVNFIKSMEVERIPVSENLDEFSYSRFIRRTSDGAWTDLEAVIEDATYQRIIVPIHQFNEGNYTGGVNLDGTDEIEISETYIAISEEVEELLGKPIYAAQEAAKLEVAMAKEEAKREIERARYYEEQWQKYDASFWKRFLYLFTGTLED